MKLGCTENKGRVVKMKPKMKLEQKSIYIKAQEQLHNLQDTVKNENAGFLIQKLSVHFRMMTAEH